MVTTCVKLNQAIEILLDHEWYNEVKKDKLQELFLKNLLEFTSIAFDISIDKDKFSLFAKNHPSPSPAELAKFLTETLNTPSTYTLLNYYQLLFLSTIYNVTKNEYKATFRSVLAKHQITPQTTETVNFAYLKIKSD